MIVAMKMMNNLLRKLFIVTNCKNRTHHVNITQTVQHPRLGARLVAILTSVYKRHCLGT